MRHDPSAVGKAVERKGETQSPRHLNRLFEISDLVVRKRPVRIVCRRKVRDQAAQIESFKGDDLFQERPQFCEGDAESTHAGIHFQMDARPFPYPGALLRNRLGHGKVKKNRDQSVLNDCPGFFPCPDPRQDENRQTKAVFSHFQGLVEMGHTKTVHTHARERLRDRNQSVSIGVCLDNPHDLDAPVQPGL
jgi:hypothetical protein